MLQSDGNTITGRGLAAIGERAPRPPSKYTATLSCGAVLGFEAFEFMPQPGQSMPCRACGGHCEVTTTFIVPATPRPPRVKRQRSVKPSKLTPELITKLREYLIQNPGSARLRVSNDVYIGTAALRKAEAQGIVTTVRGGSAVRYCVAT